MVASDFGLGCDFPRVFRSLHYLQLAIQQKRHIAEDLWDISEIPWGKIARLGKE